MSKTKARPAMRREDAEVYDWFKANGISEWLPENYKVHIEGDRLTYLAFRWEGPRGFDAGNIALDPSGASDAAYEKRQVPLLAPPSDQVKALLIEAGAWT